MSRQHLHQLYQQVQAFKQLLAGDSLSAELREQLNVLPPALYAEYAAKRWLALLQARSTQAEEAHVARAKTVPGSLHSKDQEFYALLRAKALAGEVEKQLIELRGLQEKGRSKALRRVRQRVRKDELSRCLEEGLLDARHYRREWPREKHEWRFVQKCEQMMRVGQEHKKKQRDRHFLVELFEHHRRFFEFHVQKHVSSRQQLLRKRTLAARNSLEKVSRQELDKVEKNDKERLKALKENDFDAYIQLVNNTKNTRLLNILHQTDQFLRNLGAKVLMQKGAGAEEADGPQSQEATDPQTITESLMSSSRKYYEITHTIQEAVTEQPAGLSHTILVLKDGHFQKRFEGAPGSKPTLYDLVHHMI